MTVYVVTSGCYSDYEIDAVFTSIEKAEKYVIAHASDDDIQIEIYDSDSINVDIDLKNIYRAIKYHSTWSFDYVEYEVADRPFERAFSVKTFDDDKGISHKYVREAIIPIRRTKDCSEEHLLKIARDECAKYIAEREDL